MKKGNGPLWISKASDSVNICEKKQRFTVPTGRGKQAGSVCGYIKE
jgi:hypothetical protein